MRGQWSCHEGGVAEAQAVEEEREKDETGEPLMPPHRSNNLPTLSPRDSPGFNSPAIQYLPIAGIDSSLPRTPFLFSPPDNHPESVPVFPV
jgi:hypothetical protein